MKAVDLRYLRDVLSDRFARLPRRTLLQAAGAFVVAGALLAPVARLAEAQCPTTPLNLSLVGLECVREGDDGGNHVEPYVVTYSARIGRIGLPPRGRIARTPILRGMDGGETLLLDAPVQLWPLELDRAAAPIHDLNDFIFLVQVMEHDRRTLVDVKMAWLEAILNDVLQAAWVHDWRRDKILGTLISEMVRFLKFDQTIPRRGDDCIDLPKSLWFLPEMYRACRGEEVPLVLDHQDRPSGSRGPAYRTRFVLRRGG